MLCVPFLCVLLMNQVSSQTVLRSTFTEEPFGVVTNLNDPVSFRCKASGSATMIYTWRLNGVEFDSDSDRMYDKSTGELNVTSVTPELAGFYQCVVRNPAGTLLSEKAELQYQHVTGFSEDPTDMNFYADPDPGAGTAAFHCTVKREIYTPTAVITWQRVSSSGATELIRESRFTQFQTGLRATLQIDPVNGTVDFSYSYQCVARSGSSVKTSLSARLIATRDTAYNDVDFTTLPPVGVDVTGMSSFVVGCSVRGTVGDRVWIHNGAAIVIRNNVVRNPEIFSIFGPGNLKVNDHSKGVQNFLCQAGGSLRSGSVIIGEAPSITSPVNPTVEVKEGARESLSLGCNASGTKPLTRTWVFNGGDPPSSATVENDETLRITSEVTDLHYGVYQCFVSNKYGSASVSSFLNVKYQARITVGPEDTVAMEGDTAIFHCAAKGNPAAIDYVWYKVPLNEAVIPVKSINETRFFEMDNGSLVITQTEISDSGVYECRPGNLEGTKTVAYANLTIATLPVIISAFSALTANATGSVSMPCEAIGHPAPTVTWERLVPERSAVVNDSLRISDLQASDAGQYTCIAKNVAGSASQVTELTVQFPPKVSAENFVYASIGEGQQLVCTINSLPVPSVVWFFRGTPIRNLDGLVSRRKDIYASVMTLSSITENNFGVYKCQASNLLGASEATMELLKKTIPEAPVLVRVVTESQDTIFIEWTPKFDGGAQVTQFTIEIFKEGNETRDALIVSGENTVFRIRNLEAETRYGFRVKASNQIGESEPSIIQEAITHVVKVTTVPPATKKTTDFTSETQGGTPRVEESSQQKTVGIALGVVFGILLVVGVVVLVFILYMRRREGQYSVEDEAVVERNNAATPKPLGYEKNPVQKQPAKETAIDDGGSDDPLVSSPRKEEPAVTFQDESAVTATGMPPFRGIETQM
eukprot:m.109035 g.109035  ORF g.109035 m.109035 type:complete len:929 (+) comp37335_c0_seq2:1574-4360(+)